MTPNNIYYTSLLALTLLVFSGCTPTLDEHHATPSINTGNNTMATETRDVQPSSEKRERYNKTMHTIGLKTQEDENYQRIDFITPEEKKWFKTLTYKLWDRQITRHIFLSEGLAKYPDHQYEFDFIIKSLTANDTH